MLHCVQHDKLFEVVVLNLLELVCNECLLWTGDCIAIVFKTLTRIKHSLQTSARGDFLYSIIIFVILNGVKDLFNI